jgi:hypothetical protein
MWDLEADDACQEDRDWEEAFVDDPSAASRRSVRTQRRRSTPWGYQAKVQVYRDV